MGEAAVVAEGDLTEVVNPHIFSYPAVVSHSEFPRVLDCDARFEDHATPDFRAKEAQEVALEGVWPRKPGLEE